MPSSLVPDVCRAFDEGLERSEISLSPLSLAADGGFTPHPNVSSYVASVAQSVERLDCD